ncbi:MAG: methionine adenosyltransferase, partial [archaeon GB-1867-097]|nr:methionine adenosyltransferase [Candidatus Culexmicrobium thermophilum]
NRVNGLITPCRPMSMEATAGKNPVSHIGKLYNILAKITANEIYEEVEGIREVYVKILGQIGRPIDQPIHINVQTVLEPEYKLTSEMENEIKGIMREHLERIQEITKLILSRKVDIF